VIEVTTNETQISFAIQLKHKEDEDKWLLPSALEAEQGDFSLKKYCEAFKRLSDVNKQRQFILYTNAKFDPKRTAEMTNFTMIQDDCCDGNMYFNTSSGGGNIYRFEFNDRTHQDGKITKSDYEIFFSRFKLFVCQKNFEDLKQDTAEILQNDTMNVVPKYLELFRNLHQGNFTNKKIDKATVNVHLIDIFLSPFIITDRYFPVGQNEKLKLFEKVIKEFDVTLIKNSFKNFTENLTDDFKPEEGIEGKLKSFKQLYRIDRNASSEECIMRLAKEIKIIDRSVSLLENEVKLKVLHYVFEKPIIVNFNETSEELIYKIMELHQLGSKIKFILVGQGIQSARLSRFRIFENVNHLQNNDELYSEVTGSCRLSLQGRQETTLEELIDSCEEIREHVGASEVLQMLRGKFLIGQETESIPSFYINRKVSLKVKTIDAFFDRTFFENHLAVVKFDRKVTRIQNEIRKRNINVVDVDDYLKSTQISNEPTIISTVEECSKQLLQDVLKKSDNKSVVYLDISEDNSLLIISIEDNQIHYLNRPVNILCADAGMGKTTMLKKLRNECDSRFWTIAVDLKVHNEFFKTKHDVNELFNHLIEGNENSFSKHIKAVFRSKKNIYFFFDGLDEVERSCVYNVLDSVKELSSEGFHVWISSRKNLKTKLEDRFDKVVMDMEDVEEEQQKFYIKNRLKREYNHEQIENLISKIFNSSDIDNNCQVLGKFLQLYIITQNFLFNKDLHQRMAENTFVFTKMYELFFRGRFKHNLDKEEPKNSHLFLANVEDVLELYELVAVHSVFGEEILKKLNLDQRRVRRFLNQIKTNKDPLCIVTKVNDEGKVVFEHFTYGEYFAARFFANNFDKARLIRKELFSDERKNLMMILNVLLAEENPLHLALIYRDVDQIAKYIEDKNVYDKAGRNPLHLATYIEPRCVDRKSCLIDVSVEALQYLTNISIFKKLVQFNYADCDKLFQWNALKYAFENKSFVSVEIIIERCEYSNEQLHQYTKKYINNDNLVLFCFTHGCRRLLSSILENSENYFKLNPFTIIEHTIINCYFQEKETLRFVIDILGHKYGFNVNSTNERGETALHLAAKYGKTYAVQILLEKGASVNALADSNETPLHRAVESGNSETVALLITKGACVNVFADFRGTPLHYAAKSGNSETVALLIAKGSSIKGPADFNESPLHRAAESGNSKTVALLIAKGASVNASANFNESPLHRAAESGNLQTVALLIEKGASVNALTNFNETPLHRAAESGISQIVAFLIDKGASVNALGNFNETPLHRAAESGNSQTVALLIDKGASVNGLANFNETPLHRAAQSGNLQTVAFLIEIGAYVNARASCNETPLHRAVESCSSETVALLIEKGAFVNALASYDKTPLHGAVESGNSKTIALLIAKGASVNALASYNKTPLHRAVESDNSETIALLIEGGASINALASYNKTPLHRAIEIGNSETIALLIAKGACVNALSDFKETPLHRALECGNSETIASLIAKGASVNALPGFTKTPLHRAIESENSEIISLLIAKGASVNAPSHFKETPLHCAIESGNSEAIELLIAKGASVNALSHFNETPLHRAVESGNSEIVALLIEKGASVNALIRFNQIPLHRAAKSGNSKLVALLIEKGAFINAVTIFNETPLHLASKSGNSESVALLIEKGASINALADFKETPLHRAAKSGNSETVALLIEKGASINALAAFKETPLHCAAKSGSSETVALIIGNGASINAVTKFNETPLHLASKSGNSETVALIIGKGASIEAVTRLNETPLHLASRSGNSETVALLIEKGASINALAAFKETPLHCAAKSGSSETVALIIGKGASINAVTRFNESPLHMASKSGNTETVALIIGKGASINAVTRFNETPLHLGSKSGNSEIVALLIEKGASVKARARSNETPLHLASKSGNSEIVALLIEKGASVNACAKSNETPLHLASKSGNSEIVALLIEKGASVNACAKSNETALH
jgi:ankyrin repeat protein